MITTEQTCYKCKRSLPKTKEFFARSGKGKFDRICKDCKNSWSHEYYSTHPRPVVEQKNVGGFLIRYSSRKAIWTIFQQLPWKRIISFETLEEAEGWIRENYSL